MRDIPRYNSVRCGDCGRGLTSIEIAFGRFNDPVCGRCLQSRKDHEPINLPGPEDRGITSDYFDEPPAFDVHGGL